MSWPNFLESGEYSMEMTRLEKVAAMAKKLAVDGVLITSPVNRQYATTFRSSAGVCLVTSEGKGYFYTDFRYIEAGTKAASAAGYQVEQLANSYQQMLEQVVQKHGIKTLAYEDHIMPVSQFESYKTALSCQLVPLKGQLEKLREIKEEREVECIVIAQRIAEKALDEVLKIIRPGMTEQQVAAELNYRMLCHGAEGMSFDIISVSGANSSMPHGVPTDKALEKGDFLTMDFGALYGGYHSDMTRTVAIGSATEEMRKVYDTVLKANLAGCAAMKAGIKGSDAHNVALDIITKAGYGECFQHGLGHCLGLEVHENPRAGLKSEGILETGNVITVEPGIYLAGRFGVRIEDMIWLSPDGPKNLTNAPKDLLIL